MQLSDLSVSIECEIITNKENIEIAECLTREYMRCDGVPKEYISSELDISKDDYSIDESIELLQKFKELV